MVQINFAQRSVNVKIVYYGPGMSGKTTNLEIVHQRAPDANRGELTSISTDGDRTLFFDFMPLDLGTVAGMRTQFQLYTVPGQVYYNSTRKLVLQGVDGVIFIADSSAAMLQENADSLRNLHENLLEYGKSLDTIPWVIQYNKRDLPDALSVEELQRALNPQGVPCFEAVANTGQGVFPTLKSLAARVLETIHSNSGAATARQEPGARPAASGGTPGGAHPQPAMPRGAPEPQHAAHAVPFGAPSMVAAAATQTVPGNNPFALPQAPATTVPYGFPQPSQGFEAVAAGQAAGTQVRAAIPMPAAATPAPAPLDSTALRLRAPGVGNNQPRNATSGGGGTHGTRAQAPAQAPAARQPAPPPKAAAGRRAPASAPAAAATATAPAPATRLKPRVPQPTPKSSGSRPALVATILVGLALIAGALIAKFVFNIF
jgi:signal recognition particle receptor subunit beta